MPCHPGRSAAKRRDAPAEPPPQEPLIRPRRQSRQAFLRDAAVALQRGRLRALARGLARPVCARERLFLAALEADGRARLADYVLPWPLLLAEAERELGVVVADADAPPLEAPSS